MSQGPPGLPPGQGAPHLASVDLLRALACLWVVLFHIGMMWMGAMFGYGPLAAATVGYAPRAFVWLMRLGFEGVGLFLVLSGFCLYYPMVRRSGVAGARVNLPDYARRRAGRILPAYYVSMALLAVLASLPATSAVVMLPITRLDVITHVTLVHNLLPQTLWTMNGVYWSLGLEAQLYVIFPLLVALARRSGVGAVVALGFASSMLWMLVLRYIEPMGLSPQAYNVIYEALPARLGEFTAGMGAAAFLAEGRSAPRWLLIPLALLWAPASHLARVSGLVNYPIERPFNAISSVALLVLLSRLPAAAYRPAPMRLLVAIGTASYSLYLVHQPMLLLLRTWVLGLRLERWQLALLGLTLSTALGAVFYALVERPAASRKKSLAQGEAVS